MRSSELAAPFDLMSTKKKSMVLLRQSAALNSSWSHWKRNLFRVTRLSLPMRSRMLRGGSGELAGLGNPRYDGGRRGPRSAPRVRVPRVTARARASRPSSAGGPSTPSPLALSTRALARPGECFFGTNCLPTKRRMLALYLSPPPIEALERLTRWG